MVRKLNFLSFAHPLRKIEKIEKIEILWHFQKKMRKNLKRRETHEDKFWKFAVND